VNPAGLFRSKHPLVRQYHISDCGPACLVAILRDLGGQCSVTKAREVAGTDQGGTTFLGLQEGARALGLDASGATGSFDDLRSIDLPCIAHVVKEGMQHFVVIWKVEARRILVGDPGSGIEWMDRPAFEKIWVKNAVLLVTAGPNLADEEHEGWAQWVFRHIADSWDWLIQSIFLGIAYTGLGLFSAVVLQQFIDSVLMRGEMDRLGLVGAFLLALYLARGGVGYVRQRFVLRLNRRSSQALAGDFIGRLFALPTRFFDTRRGGDITARLQDAGRIQAAVLQLLGGASVDAIVLIGSISLVFYFSSELGAVLTVILPLYALLALMATRRIKRGQQKVFASYGALQAEYYDALSGIETIRGFGVGPAVSRKHLHLFDEHQNQFEKLGMVNASVQSVLDTLANLMFLSVLIIGGISVANGELTLGRMLAAYSLVGMAIPSVQQVIQSILALQGASAAADRIKDIMVSEPEDPDTGARLGRIAQMEIVDGSFRWPGAPSQMEDLQFVLRRGEILGLTGPNGVGKSTLINLLTRRYPLTSGQLLVNGVDATLARLSDFRRRVQVVPERVAIFNGSLGQNLFMGLRNQEDQASAVQPLSDVRIQDFLTRFPAGLATRVGEGGRRLSAGESQMVGLLRAMVASPDVLILDEALASLDTAFRDLALELIRGHARVGMVLVISHHREVLSVAHRTVLLTRDGLRELAGGRPFESDGLPPDLNAERDFTRASA
jgi:ATP-binding cassette, subfamily C, bacteriocin exporter